MIPVDSMLFMSSDTDIGKRRQKSRRNQGTCEVSPTIPYVLLVTHPQDEQKSHHDLCREGHLVSLGKQKGLLIEGDKKLVFCQGKVCSPMSREVLEVT